jgi:hypothetical protein
MFLQRFSNNSCCLCGSTERLTGEHKIKASALRKEFGREPLVIVVMDSTEERMKSAQSTNSKHLKFSISICETCNTSRTQQADREFDRFHQLALEKFKAGKDPLSIFELERYSRNSEPYLNVFRYFAKLLSCHLAEVNAPIPILLARFAIGVVQNNCIWLEVKNDPTYLHVITLTGEQCYAAHGGLVVYSDKETGDPNAFHSTLTVGPLQYIFHIRLNELEKNEIKAVYPDFYQWCVSKADEARESPIPDGTLVRLGLKCEDA